MLKLEKNDQLADKIKKGRWLVDFNATWCGPCKMLEKVLEKLDESHSIIGVDIDVHMPLAQSFGIMSVPTLILFNDGQEIKRTIGFHSYEELQDWLSN